MFSTMKGIFWIVFTQRSVESCGGIKVVLKNKCHQIKPKSVRNRKMNVIVIISIIFPIVIMIAGNYKRVIWVKKSEFRFGISGT